MADADLIILGYESLRSGRVRARAQTPDGRKWSVVVDRNDADEEHVRPLFEQMIASGRYDQPPPSPPAE